jgi:hypothetical protein
MHDNALFCSRCPGFGPQSCVIGKRNTLHLILVTGLCHTYFFDSTSSIHSYYSSVYSYTALFPSHVPYAHPPFRDVQVIIYPIWRVRAQEILYHKPRSKYRLSNLINQYPFPENCSNPASMCKEAKPLLCFEKVSVKSTVSKPRTGIIRFMFFVLLEANSKSVLLKKRGYHTF